MISEEQKHIIVSKIKPYKPSMIGIFGSYARNEQDVSSDLDILVDFEETIDLISLIGLELDLGETLGIKVDLVTKRSLHPRFSPYIEKELRRIL